VAYSAAPLVLGHDSLRFQKPPRQNLSRDGRKIV